MRIKKSFTIVAACALVACSAIAAMAMQNFQHTITGETLKILEEAPETGRDTPAVKSFLETGVNPYNGVKGCLPKGEEAYLVACSGCHGHVGEGKLGPGLADSYWTYPKNLTDKGLFETIFGGAQGMMGPHGGHLELDELLKLMAWIRNLNVGTAEDASWLTDAQKASFKPFDQKVWETTGKAAAEKEECKISGE